MSDSRHFYCQEDLENDPRLHQGGYDGDGALYFLDDDNNVYYTNGYCNQPSYDDSNGSTGSPSGSSPGSSGGGGTGGPSGGDGSGSGAGGQAGSNPAQDGSGSGTANNSSVVDSAQVTEPIDGGQLPEVAIRAKRIVANPRPATQSRQQVAPQQPNVYQSKKTTAHNNNSKNSSLAISQASHDHVAADMQVIADALHRMQELERVIKIEQEGIKGMNTLMYTYLGNDIGNSWNLFYSVPQLVNGFIYGDPTKPMAEQIAYELNKLEGYYNQYNEAVRDYRVAQNSLAWRLGNSDFIPVDNKTILFKVEDENGNPNAKNNNQKNYLAALALLGITHGNVNTSERNYAVYEITINGNILKYGVADAERLTASGVPVRLAQQISKLKRVLPEEFIVGRVLEMRYTTKLEIKALEDIYILKAAEKMGIPIGNAAHIKAYLNEFAILYLDAKILKILRALRLIKF